MTRFVKICLPFIFFFLPLTWRAEHACMKFLLISLSGAAISQSGYDCQRGWLIAFQGSIVDPPPPPENPLVTRGRVNVPTPITRDATFGALRSRFHTGLAYNGGLYYRHLWGGEGRGRREGNMCALCNLAHGRSIVAGFEWDGTESIFYLEITV